MSDVKAAFDKIQSRFDEGADLGDLNAVYVFQLGETEGDWTIRVDSGKGSVQQGGAEDATCTIKVSDENFVKMANGSAQPQKLFITGKLKVSGNMGQALKLQKILG